MHAPRRPSPAVPAQRRSGCAGARPLSPPLRRWAAPSGAACRAAVKQDTAYADLPLTQTWMQPIGGEGRMLRSRLVNMGAGCWTILRNAAPHHYPADRHAHKLRHVLFQLGQLVEDVFEPAWKKERHTARGVHTYACGTCAQEGMSAGPQAQAAHACIHLYTCSPAIAPWYCREQITHTCQAPN